jgi:hypothetical protein
MPRQRSTAARVHVGKAGMLAAPFLLFEGVVRATRKRMGSSPGDDGQ